MTSPLLAALGLIAASTLPSRAAALAELRGPSGPQRFGVVSDRLYRGGQPTMRHLALLAALGVKTVVDLRSEDRKTRSAEAAEVQRIGMRFVSTPFYGSFGAGSDFLARTVAAIQAGGAVYVHCNVGRDRTSLVVALYRVMVDGWEPRLAWQREATDYGYTPGLWYRAIVHSYWAAVRELGARK